MGVLRSMLAGSVVLLAIGSAQGQTGALTVAVSDADATPLAGATVTLRHELGFVKTTSILTGDDGVAAFPVLQAGPGYSIEVSVPGYAPIRLSDLRVSLSRTVTLPVQMTERLEERVTVVAEREVVELERTEASTKFDGAFIQDLPVPGRFYQNVLTMAPGVQDPDEDGNPNVHGSRDRDFSAMVSGVRNVDPLTGQWMSRVNPNSIQEMEIITAGAGVEFGRAQGGFARIVQKQGSNRFEGVLELYYRTSRIDRTGAQRYSTVPTEEFEWFQPALQLSGPIVKDKLWFRLSHEYRKIDAPITLTSAIQVAEREEWTHSDQITWQVSPRNKLAFQLDADPQRNSNVGVSTFRPPDAALASERSGETYRVTWTAPFSPRVLVESTLAWQDMNRVLAPNTDGVLNRCISGLEIPVYLTQAQCTNLNSGEISGSYYRTQDDHSQRLTLRSTATVYGGSFWGMTHQFKFGITTENERYFRELRQEPFGSFLQQKTRVLIPELNLSIPEIQRRFFVRISVPREDDVRATGTNWGLFVEDQFKPRRNLTFTVGLRLDREELTSGGHLTFGDRTVRKQREMLESLIDVGIHSNVAHRPAFIGFEQRELFESELTRILCEDEVNTGNCSAILGQQVEVMFRKASELYDIRKSRDLAISNTNVSPAFAVAWSPGSNGKTALKFAAGRHYNLIPLVVPLIELEPSLTTVTYLRRQFPGFPPGQWSPEQNLLIPDVQTVRPDLRTPYQDEWTFAIERELWPETSLSVRYVSREFKDQIQDINTNEDIGDFGRCKVQTAPASAQDRHPWIADSPIDPARGFASTVSSSFTEDPCPGGFCDPYDYYLIDDWLTDPYSGIRYPDTRVGPGDGWDAALRTSLPSVPGYRGLDDCVGTTHQGVTFSGTVNAFLYRRPDGRIDRYTQTPFFGDILEVGNHNAIDYRAVVVEFVRRQFRSWEMNASYTWSQAEGNGEDFFQTLGDDPSLRNDSAGFQSYDQRHVAKLNATTITPWGIRLGTAITWQSGLPFSVIYEDFAYDAAPPSLDDVGLGDNRGRVRQTYPSGTRNDRRNPSFWNVDLKATKEFHPGRTLDLQLSAEIFNLLNDGTYFVYSSEVGRGEQINGVNGGQFRFGRRWQIGLRLAF